MENNRPNRTPEGMSMDKDGKISDADFHERQLGLTREKETDIETQPARKAILASQAKSAERGDPNFAIRSYEALLQNFPDAEETQKWMRRIDILKQNGV